MSYRLISSNDIAIKYPEVNDCDAYSPFYIPRFCPLAENEEEI